MLDQNALDLLDRFGISLHGMSGADNLFRSHTVDMRAHVFHDPIARFIERLIAIDGNNRMGHNSRGNRNG